MSANVIDYQHFHAVEIRVGQVLEVSDNTKAKKPAYVLTIDFGAEIGVRTASAQLTSGYEKQELLGKRVLAVLNFPPRQVANIKSEVLVLAAVSEGAAPVLVSPLGPVPNGSRVL